MGYYLIDNPPNRSQFRTKRRWGNPMGSGCIEIHTAEGSPAQSVARFIQQRDTPGSYHMIIGTDTVIPMMPDTYEAFGDGTGLNPQVWHLSFAMHASDWGKNRAQDELMLRRGAHEAAAFLVRYWGNTTQAMRSVRRITRAQAGAGDPGMLQHGDSDPGRRSDAWAKHPLGGKLWTQFLDLVEANLGASPPPDEGDFTVDQADRVIQTTQADHNGVKANVINVAESIEDKVDGLVGKVDLLSQLVVALYKQVDPDGSVNIEGPTLAELVKKLGDG